jgi:hypothetical protein
VREVERGQSQLLLDRGARDIRPVQAAGDHQVDDQPDVVVEADRDALAEPRERCHRRAFDRFQRRRDRAQQERIRDAHAFEPPPADVTIERLDVDGDVRKFGHEVWA